MGFFDKKSGTIDLTNPETKILASNEAIEKKASIEAPKFVFEEASDSDKLVICIYGEKGASKTSTALGFPGSIVALSFDMKTAAVKKNLYKSDNRIKVFDAVKYFDENPDTVLQSAYDTYNYALFLMDKLSKEYPKKIDWVVIDGLEIWSGIAENVMRYRNGLKPFQGISNLNLWKERKLIMRSLHNKALDIANKGLIYTTYSADDELIEEGSFISKKKVPKWADVVLFTTDIVIHVDTKQSKDGKKFLATIDNSKVDSFLKTGAVLDLTGHRIFEVLK